MLWHSRAAFVADAQGTVDLTRDAPVSGDYTGISVMGLIWSQRPEDDKAREVFPQPVTEPLTTTLPAPANGESLHASVVQRLSAPGVPRHEVRDEGLVGTLYLPDAYARPGPRPAVLILNG
ncbi:acyl-CoA thioesterase/BAAT N-terminal domain-containing protein, partial [Klebsiella pneumoniae]|uniref:acyl-CoA thioesterase/BAAT N-terminal domain-containing protein n=1 Tax=Klebsiella pneumoniae TaxID=573 RepID=UPI00215DC40C